jgi:hydrogenase small subunit
METVLYLLYQAAGLAPMIPLDEALRPTWLFGQTVHEAATAAATTSRPTSPPSTARRSASSSSAAGARWRCCNVPKRGWVNGVGGCPNVGGVCIGCTMPGFPDKFMPFLDEPPGAKMSSAAVLMYGRTVRALRNFTRSSLEHEPRWRAPGAELTTGYRRPGLRHERAPTWSRCHWDPITRIVGSLGIHTKIDFAAAQVAECGRPRRSSAASASS